jgi:antitoxin ParD1/3/4
MATLTLSLPDQTKDWIDRQARAGRHDDAEDYVRALIEKEQERQSWIEETQKLIDEGLESGVSKRSMADIRSAARGALGLPPDEL